MSSPIRFEVVRRNRHRHPGGLLRTAGDIPVASFPTREEAEVEAARREIAARAAVNPFTCDILWADRTEMPEPVFYDWVGDQDLPLPPEADGKRDWPAWWESVRERGPGHMNLVWPMLPRLQFFGVREVRPGPRVYLLLRNAAPAEEEYEPVPDGDGVRMRWTGRMRVLPEGGDPLLLSFDRTRLEREVERLEQQRIAEGWDPPLQYRNERGMDPLDPEPTEYVPGDPSFLYEIAELELDGTVADTTSPVRVVFRQGHFIANGEWTQCEEPTCLIPVRAFLDPADTDRHRDESNRAIHETTDPVFFAPGWSNGTTGSKRLNELFVIRGLPAIPAQFRFGNKFPSAGIDDLGRWWRENALKLTRDMRVKVWELLGDYRFLSPILQFTPDQPGYDWV